MKVVLCTKITYCVDKPRLCFWGKNQTPDTNTAVNVFADTAPKQARPLRREACQLAKNRGNIIAETTAPFEADQHRIRLRRNSTPYITAEAFAAYFSLRFKNQDFRRSKLSRINSSPGLPLPNISDSASARARPPNMMPKSVQAYAPQLGLSRINQGPNINAIPRSPTASEITPLFFIVLNPQLNPFCLLRH